MHIVTQSTKSIVKTKAPVAVEKRSHFGNLNCREKSFEMKKKILRKLFKKGNTSNVNVADNTTTSGMIVVICIVLINIGCVTFC